MTNKVQLTLRKEVFVCRAAPDANDIPKKAGFHYDTTAKHWYSRIPRDAAKLAAYADEEAKAKLQPFFLSVTPFTGRIPYPKKETPKDFQIKRAVPWALSRNNSYLALDPGLGKTICAALTLNALNANGNGAAGVYVCPPFLIPDVETKLARWATYSPIISPHPKDKPDVLIVPDSMLAKGLIEASVRDFVRTQSRKGKEIVGFVDEAHRFKNLDAKRTRFLFKEYTPLFDRKVFMSGTPMPNRPYELYPVLSQAAPEVINFRNAFEYGKYFCNGFQNEYGWDFSGASHIKELSDKIKEKFMLRILKRDVLTELEPVRESLAFIGRGLPSQLARLEREAVRGRNVTDLMKHEIGEEHLSSYRRVLGAYKVKDAVKFINTVLEDTNEAVLVFAHHKEVIKGLYAGLKAYAPSVIDGDTKGSDRVNIANDFLTNNDRRVVILNMTAGGVGLDLYKATRVIFVEYSWTPAENRQCIDRADRIGQTGSVYVQYLVYRNSIDAAILETNMAKKKVTDQI